MVVSSAFTQKADIQQSFNTAVGIYNAIRDNVSGAGRSRRQRKWANTQCQNLLDFIRVSELGKHSAVIQYPSGVTFDEMVAYCQMHGAW